MLKIILCDSSMDYLRDLKQRIMTIIIDSGYNAKVSCLATTPAAVLEYFTVQESSLEKQEGFIYVLEIHYGSNKLMGIDLAKQLRQKDRECYIVFNTESMESIQLVMSGLIRPSGFFIKPIEEEDLQILLGDIYRDYLNKDCADGEMININIGSSIYRIGYDQILYFEAFQKKVYIYTANQRIGYYDSLSSLECKLGDQFVRCHKSYIINKDKIARVNFSEMQLEMENGAQIDISRSYKNVLKDNF